MHLAMYNTYMFDISIYKELYHYDDKRSLVLNDVTGDIRMMKKLSYYDEEVYSYLVQHSDKHIPKIYEIYRGNDNSLIVIEEYIQGNSFDVIINDHNMDDKEKLSYFMQLLEGLAFLHNASKPIIHRDLKPANIMVTDGGLVKILDYDAAKTYKPESDSDTTLLGTNGVAAPEQYGFMQSDPRSDVFAVGKMLSNAFPNNSRVKKIADRACSFDPANRYSNANELADVLSRRISPTLKLKPLFPPPGFRTRKWWKMMIAIIFYPWFLFLLIGFHGSEIPIENTVMIIMLALFILVIIDICFSWTGIFDVLPFVTHKNFFLRTLFKLIFSVAAITIIFLLGVIFLLMINQYTHMYW